MNIQEDYVNLEMCCFREMALTLYFLLMSAPSNMERRELSKISNNKSDKQNG